LDEHRRGPRGDHSGHVYLDIRKRFDDREPDGDYDL
jgi:hypothetical protein